VSLGCAKNLVDAEIMLGALLRSGLEIVNDPAQADAVIVNTCSFIDAAQEESVDAILESTAERDGQRPHQAVIVSGCLPQRFRNELPKLLPEVDAFMGIDQVEEVARIVEEAVRNRAHSQGTPGSPALPARETAATRKKVRQKLQEVAEAEPGHDHSHSHSHAHPEPENRLRGTPAFGRTRRTVAVPDADTETHTTTTRTAQTTLLSPATAPAVEVHVRPNYIPHWDTPRFRLTPNHFAYVKIAEGCNHPCSFCIIPRMRGSHRSRALNDIVEEARRLLDQGVRELNLISQDSTYYGLDLRPKHSRNIASPDRFRAAAAALPSDTPTLVSLLRALNDLPGEFWVRLLYTHPAHWTDDLIRTMAECPKVARYVDMPLQHIHDDILARMRRETDGAYIRDLIVRLRAGIPGIALRTTFIVGFPGETRAHFETLKEFIRTTRFERLGVFTYSKEDGTVAGRMAGQVPQRTRSARRDAAMKTQHAIARELSAAMVGRQVRVLVEGQATATQLEKARVSSWEHGLIRASPEATDAPQLSKGRRYSVARTEVDAPDIDGRVFVRGALKVGEFAQVRIVGHTDYDLIAETL
jgi:ribosomal protein S12 methylthiotransferase